MIYSSTHLNSRNFNSQYIIYMIVDPPWVIYNNFWFPTKDKRYCKV